MPPTADRSLLIDPATRMVLEQLNAQLGLPPVVLHREDLDALEREVGSLVPDGVLALLVAQGRSVGAIAESTQLLNALGATANLPHSKQRRALIAFDHWGEHPMYFAVFEATRDRSSTALEVWDARAWTSVREFGVHDVPSYVYARYVGIHREGEPLDLTAPLLEAHRLTLQVVEAQAAPVRWVEHAKFGRGRVLREADGAWVVEFESGPTRAIDPHFLRRV